MLPTLAARYARCLEEPRLRRALTGGVHGVGGERPGIFVRHSLALLACDGPTRESFQDFLEGVSRRDASRRHRIPVSRLDALIDTVRRSRGGASRRTRTGVAEEKTLDRLVLNVSNDCNLRCTYCYAAGGAYGGRRGLMTRDTALTALDVFLAAFPRINRIQFFGGEPLLNLGVIEAVACALEERREAGRLSHTPRLGVVTNGTLSPDAFVALCRRVGMEVTVSVDGPPDIHDRLRGEGTFDKVRAFTARLAAEGLEFGIEGTYTALHAEAGLRLVDLLAFYRREFGLAEVHVPWCSRPPGDSLGAPPEEVEKDYRAAVGCSLDPATRDRIAALAFATRLLDAVTRQEPVESYCPAGLHTLAVDAEGDIYPCFMFVGRHALRLGSVRGGLADARAGGAVSRLLAGKSDPSCAGCWARPLCFGCAGADHVISGDAFRKSSCGVMRAMADEVLRRVLALADQ